MATKRYWTISEVADQFGVNTSLLRYWEKEFKALEPKKQGSGKRAYTAQDIEIIGVLHDLLKGKLHHRRGQAPPQAGLKEQRQTEALRQRLEAIRAELVRLADDVERSA